MKLLNNTHARIVSASDTYPLYTLSTDDCSGIYNIPCLTKATVETAMTQLYYASKWHSEIQQLPVLVPYFETYDDLLQNYPELLI